MLIHWKSLFAAPLSLLVVALLATGASAQDDDTSKEEADPGGIELEFDEGGPVEGRIELQGFGGEMPDEFRKMLEAAQEMQKLQKQYQKKVTALIEAAKNLEDADNLMAEIPKIAKLAKETEAIKKEMKEKQKEAGRAVGGPIGGGIRIFGGGDGGVLPIFPGGRELELPEEG